MSEISFDNEAYTLVRAPLGSDHCSYALFPGLSLARCAPGLVVLLYDSLINQRPDTGMFLYRAREGFDPLLNRKWAERLLTRWRNLGKPKMIVACPEDRKFLRAAAPEIPQVSLYGELLAHKISGGCNKGLYKMIEPEGSPVDGEVTELALSMGVEPRESDDPDPELSGVPFLTSSMDLRNSLRGQGHDAFHILELIYGVGTTDPRDEQKENLLDLKQTLVSLFWNET